MTDAKPFQKIPGGLLIAFEGIDGSGKTTMARRTAEAMKQIGYYAVYLREPTDGPHGRALREIMVSDAPRDPQREVELFLLDRQEDVKQNISPVLELGGVVCIDRYYISSMAYQGALGIDVRHIQQANEKFAPKPDVILYFDISVEDALERITRGRSGGANNFEKLDYLKRVTGIFNAMEFPNLVRIDASRTEDEVFAEIQAAIARHVKATA